MNTHPCSRCNGFGTIQHHANVLGGVCFKCHGKGTQKNVPASKAQKWSVTAAERETGERLSVFFVRAKSEENALAVARATLARGNGFLPESATVAPVSS